jgi:sorbitol-specific phosphotransferase system component IIA
VEGRQDVREMGYISLFFTPSKQQDVEGEIVG